MVFKLRSPAVAPSCHIPAKYTCDGSDLSPPLRWTEPPLDTKSFALIVDDPRHDEDQVCHDRLRRFYAAKARSWKAISKRLA